MRKSAKPALELHAARVRAEALCSRAETCRADLRRKLAAWGLGEEEAEGLLRRLQAERFVDDERYARAYARDKFRFNGWGRQKIARMLRAKRIDREIVDAVLAGIGEEDFSAGLLRLLVAKAQTIRAKDNWELRAKLVRFALARGYEAQRIRAVLDEALAQAPPRS